MALQVQGLETAYDGYLTIYVATLAGDDGEVVHREIEDHGRAVAVLPYDPERRLAILVRLPRAPVIWAGGPSELLEALAGMLEDEPAADCARREAMEEAGLKLGELEPAGSAWSSPGVSSERIDLFLAPYRSADRVAAGGGVAGEQENITVVETPLADLWAQLEAGEIQDMKTLTLVYALRARRPELF